MTDCNRCGEPVEPVVYGSGEDAVRRWPATCEDCEPVWSPDPGYVSPDDYGRDQTGHDHRAAASRQRVLGNGVNR